MANSNGWGDGTANNSIGWGKGANNLINWGKSYLSSNAGKTDISGIVQGNTAPFVINLGSLSNAAPCGDLNETITLQDFEIGGTPTPTITFEWYIGQNLVSTTPFYQTNIGVTNQIVSCYFLAINSAGSINGLIGSAQIQYCDI